MKQIEAMKLSGEYEENAGATESNDKQLLLRSGADVYVTVDLMRDNTGQEISLSLILQAYEVT